MFNIEGLTLCFNDPRRDRSIDYAKLIEVEDHLATLLHFSFHILDWKLDSHSGREPHFSLVYVGATYYSPCLNIAFAGSISAYSRYANTGLFCELRFDPICCVSGLLTAHKIGGSPPN